MKRFFALILLVISFFVLIFPVEAETADYILTNPKTYEFSKTYKIKNIGTTKVTNLKIKVVIGTKNEFTYQKDIKFEYNPQPKNITVNAYDNQFAEYELKELLPGDSFEIKVSRKIESSDIKFNINPNNLKLEKDLSKYQIYLQPLDKIESDNSLIVSKAKELTRTLFDDYSKAKAIFEFVNYNMVYDTSDTYSNKGALSALTSGRGVCMDYAALFVALCRAVSIPARVVEGYRLKGDFENIKENEWKDIKSSRHAWAEYYLEGYGWIPVEPTLLFTVNGVKQVYWDGFSQLKGSEYITTSIYDGRQYDIDVWYEYIEGEKPDLNLEIVEEATKIPSSKVVNPVGENENNNSNTDELQRELIRNYLINTNLDSIVEKGMMNSYLNKVSQTDKYFSGFESLILMLIGEFLDPVPPN